MPVNRFARRTAQRRSAFQADLRGARRMKRLFRALPEAMRGELAGSLERAGRLLQAAMQDRAPKRTQALAGGLTSRVLTKSLRLRVGLLGTPSGRAKLFYGRILDLGRKAQTVTIKRGPRTGKKMDVRAIAPKRFITGQFTRLRGIINQEVKGVWGRALRSIGAGDD